MGLLSWLFPSDEDRISRARELIGREKWAEARNEVMGIQGAEATAVLEEAKAGLVRLNLHAAETWAQAGDERRVHHHLELAHEFHDGGLEEDFRALRRTLRLLRAERNAEEQRKKEIEEERLLQVDPIGLTGGPSLLDDPPLPDDMIGPDAQELQARLAILVDNYPESLRGQVHDLGPEFARALLDLEDDRPDLALQGLLALPDDVALVQWERARTAYRLGDPKAAVRALRQFGELARGHHPMGRQHSAAFLAQCLAESGDPAEGLRVLRDARSRDPDVGGPLFAQLLEATGQLAEAEQVLVKLIRKAPSATPLYSLLARVRLAGGHRTQAMRALEAALEATHCTPGRCGYQPPNLHVIRSLATLYYEDGIELERASELAEQAAGLVEKPTWEDLYLKALASRTHQEPDAQVWAKRLWENTPPEDPRLTKLETHLPVA